MYPRLIQLGWLKVPLFCLLSVINHNMLSQLQLKVPHFSILSVINHNMLSQLQHQPARLAQGSDFTCFISTKTQILTHKALLGFPVKGTQFTCFTRTKGHYVSEVGWLKG